MENATTKCCCSKVTFARTKWSTIRKLDCDKTSNRAKMSLRMKPPQTMMTMTTKSVLRSTVDLLRPQAAMWKKTTLRLPPRPHEPRDRPVKQ